MSEQLQDAMTRCNTLNDLSGVKQRGGKKYTMVKDRVTAWREVFGTEHGVESEILKDDGTMVAIKSIIKNSDGRILATGVAEEVRGSSNVNKTSALENWETSALGRALSALGLHGGEFASENEMDKVDRMTKEQPTLKAAPTPEPETDVYQKSKQQIWVEDAIEGFKKHKHTGDHAKWASFNKPTISDIKKVDQGLYQAVLDAWQKRKMELEGKIE